MTAVSWQGDKATKPEFLQRTGAVPQVLAGVALRATRTTDSDGNPSSDRTDRRYLSPVIGRRSRALSFLPSPRSHWQAPLWMRIRRAMSMHFLDYIVLAYAQMLNGISSSRLIRGFSKQTPVVVPALYPYWHNVLLPETKN